MRICVFCGSSYGVRPEYRKAAHALGRSLADHEIGLVYGGASVGLMGAVADGALDGGGEVTGILPEALAKLELAHPKLSTLHIVGSMHERKMMMADLSDAFIALPGGIGTFEETFEILTWTQLGIHRKPLGLLNIEGFYDPLIAFLDSVVVEGFVKQQHRDMLQVEHDPRAMIQALQSAQLPATPKWVDQKLDP